MGEFADFEPAPAVAARPAPAALASQPDDAIDMAIEDDFEDAFAAGLEEDAAAPVAAVRPSQPADTCMADDQTLSQRA